MFRLGEIARDNKGAVFNLALSLLVITIGPYYIREIKLIRDFAQPNTLIALLLILFIIAEPVALYLKINSVYGKDHVKRELTIRYIFLWVAHIIVNVFAGIVLANAIPPSLHFLKLPLFFFIGFKEFVLLFYLLNRQVTDEPKKDGGWWPQPKPASDRNLFLSDAVLSMYGFLMYGITWQSMGASSWLGGSMDDVADGIGFRLFTYTLFFFMMYLPIRMGHFIEEWLNNRTAAQKRNYRVTMLVTMASCIGPLFTGGPAPAREHINDVDPSGKTVLIESIEYEPMPYLERLIEAGADVNAKDTLGYTALHYASKGGRPKAVKLLLENGADPNVRTNGSTTPLALAAGFRKEECVALLLEYHADPNLGYDDGETPLMIAAEQGFAPGIIETLINYKADVNAVDSNGWNALMRFEHYHNLTDSSDKKVFDILLKQTDLQHRDKWGHTIVWHAMRYYNWPYADVGRALIDAGAAYDSTDIITKKGWNDITNSYVEHDSQQE